MNPLRIEAYLYPDGNYIFSLTVDPNDKFYSIIDDRVKYVAIDGNSAHQLFEVVKNIVRKMDLPAVESYRWGDQTNLNFCNKSKDIVPEYNCMINI